MSLSFPSSPTLNQEVTQNGRTWRWSGYAWQIVANVAGHASAHGSGGSDPLSISASQINSGTIDESRLPSVGFHPFLLMGG